MPQLLVRTLPLLAKLPNFWNHQVRKSGNIESEMPYRNEWIDVHNRDEDTEGCPCLCASVKRGLRVMRSPGHTIKLLGSAQQPHFRSLIPPGGVSSGYLTSTRVQKHAGRAQCLESKANLQSQSQTQPWAKAGTTAPPFDLFSETLEPTVASFIIPKPAFQPSWCKELPLNSSGSLHQGPMYVLHTLRQSNNSNSDHFHFPSWAWSLRTNQKTVFKIFLATWNLQMVKR